MGNSKILSHPDKEEIINLLTNGESVRGLETKLKKKYPKNKNLWVSSVTLQDFRKRYLKLDGQVLKDIQEVGQVAKIQQEELDKQRLLKSTTAYQNKINEIADSKLDVARKILQLDAVIESRMEYWFNVVADGKEAPSKGDKELRLFMDKQMALLAQYKKFVEGLADKTVDYNVNVTVMNDQVTAIRDAIRECMAEFEPEVALKFMEKLSNKLGDLSFRREETVPIRIEELQGSELKLLDDDGETDEQ